MSQLLLKLDSCGGEKKMSTIIRTIIYDRQQKSETIEKLSEQIRELR